MDLFIKGNSAIVVGGASGIGLATAECFAAEGVNVALWDMSSHVLQVAARIATEYEIQAIGIRADVSNEQSVVDAMHQTLATFPSIDHLVHGAAIGSGKFGFPFTNLQPSDWIKILDINVMGMVHVAHVVAPYMIQRRKGTMVYLASVAGQIGSQTDRPTVQVKQPISISHNALPRIWRLIKSV